MYLYKLRGALIEINPRSTVTKKGGTGERHQDYDIFFYLSEHIEKMPMLGHVTFVLYTV